MSYKNYSFEDQKLYLSGHYVPGVQYIESSISTPVDDPLAVGWETPIADSEQGVLNGEFSASRFLVSTEDPVTGFFENGTSGHLRYTDNNAYVFETGLITDYVCSCSVDEVPTLDFSLSTWGKTFTSITGYGDQPGPEDDEEGSLFVPSVGDLEIEITNCAGGHDLDLSSNAVTKFEYRIDIDWQDLAVMGDRNPAGFFVRYPIQVNATIEFEINDFVSPDFIKFLCTPVIKDLELRVYGCDITCSGPRSLLRKFTLPAAKMIDYTQFAGIDDVLTGEIVFQSTSRNITNLSSLLTI